MQKLSKPLVTLLVATLTASPNAFAYGEFNARLDCMSKVSGWNSGYTRPRDINVDSRGHGSYRITGKVDDRHGKDHRFDCRIEHREVVSWNVSSRNDSDKSDNKALAIGAGIVGLAAIAAIASNSNKDAEHEGSKSQYNSGRSNPFDDLKYLQNECKRVVRQHLVEDHGRVDELVFKTADLDSRVLTGLGKVYFENDQVRRLDYRCQFDRGGNIHDGSYEYRHEYDR